MISTKVSASLPGTNRLQRLVLGGDLGSYFLLHQCSRRPSLVNQSPLLVTSLPLSFRAGEAAAKGLGVAPAQIHIARRGAHGDALHAQLRKAEQLIGLADAVLVQVFPELDAGVGHVVGVKLAVGDTIGVHVQIGQGFKAVAGSLTGVGATGEDGVVAKQACSPRRICASSYCF